MMDKKRSLCGIVVAGDGDLFHTGEVIAPIGEHEGGRRTGVSSSQTDPQSWSAMTRTTNTLE